jgi:hypothetical protein
MTKTSGHSLPQLAVARTFVILMGFLLAQLSIALSTAQVTAADPILTPSQPALTSPTKASWSKSSSVDFSWDAVDGATKYQLRYGKSTTCASDPNDSDPTHAGQFAGDAMILETTDVHQVVDGLADGQWCWQVRAVKNVVLGTDTYSDWSDIWSVKVDTVVPVVTLDKTSVSPNFKGTIDDLTAVLTAIIDGTAHPEITITVSDQTNDQNTYDWTLKLPDNLSAGDHTLKIKAVDAAGNEAITFGQTFTVKELIVTQSRGVDPNITQAATLPLVPAGPLVFVAPVPAPVQTSVVSEGDIAPIPSASIPTEQPAQKAVLAAEVSPKLNGHTNQAAVEATGQGWALFGVTWYWWVLGGGIAALGWSLLARWRLASRLA